MAAFTSEEMTGYYAKVEANQMQEAEIAKVEAENKTEQAKIDKNKKFPRLWICYDIINPAVRFAAGKE